MQGSGSGRQKSLEIRIRNTVVTVLKTIMVGLDYFINVLALYGTG
jgi:hypothetical protein